MTVGEGGQLIPPQRELFKEKTAGVYTWILLLNPWSVPSDACGIYGDGRAATISRTVSARASLPYAGAPHTASLLLQAFPGKENAVL